MSQKIKMDDSELQEVQQLQSKFQQNIFHLGKNTLNAIQAKRALETTQDREVKLMDELATLQKDESELIDKFLKKYGEGSLNLEEGVFISDKIS